MIVAHWVGDPWGFFGFLVGLAVLALIVIGIVALVGSGGGSVRSSAALRLIEERYARGEIGRDEYLERRRVLTGQPPADRP
ncbi:MAG TPA: SHOCT domain-containing protein [Solirubrobacterales bacterium]|nr:SHOCT domain-containing protein [Solirubrobacterales bacterium]